MTIAGFVNLAMMATAAAAFHFNGHTGIADLDQAYLTLEPLLSHAAATIFGLSPGGSRPLFNGSGHAGGTGGDARVCAFPYSAVGSSHYHHDALVYRHLAGAGSHANSGDEPVLLSFGIALALVPLLVFTSNRALMGELVNSSLIKRTGWVIVVLVVSLNGWLLVGTAAGL